jgi:hypothetical protein
VWIERVCGSRRGTAAGSFLNERSTGRRCGLQGNSFDSDLLLGVACDPAVVHKGRVVMVFIEDKKKLVP